MCQDSDNKSESRVYISNAISCHSFFTSHKYFASGEDQAQLITVAGSTKSSKQTEKASG